MHTDLTASLSIPVIFLCYDIVKGNCDQIMKSSIMTIFPNIFLLKMFWLTLNFSLSQSRGICINIQKVAISLFLMKQPHGLFQFHFMWKVMTCVRGVCTLVKINYVLNIKIHVLIQRVEGRTYCDTISIITLLSRKKLWGKGSLFVMSNFLTLQRMSALLSIYRHVARIQ